MSKEISLNETECSILNDAQTIRNNIQDADSLDSSSNYAFTKNNLTQQSARLAVTSLNILCCASVENTKAIIHLIASVTGQSSENAPVEYDVIIPRIVGSTNFLMQQHSYTLEDVSNLQAKLKSFLKCQKNPPVRNLYISDCHFYHNNICYFMDKRGFTGYEEMNEYMIQKWNSKVTPRDHVYILGDFSIAKGEKTNEILKQLNGKLHLIIGNHDIYLEDKSFDRELFLSIDSYKEIHEDRKLVILSHYPVFCYKDQYRIDKDGNPLTYMLYGHVHNTHDEMLVHRFIMATRATKVGSRYTPEPIPIPCNMINCFCMFSDYQPMTLDEWIEIDKSRRDQIEDSITFVHE